jgi:hypothetical protein
MRTLRLLILAPLVAPVVGFVAASCSSNTKETARDAGFDSPAKPDTSTSDVAAHPDAPSDAANASDVGSASCTGLAYCDDFETYEAGTVTNGETLGPWAASVGGVTMTVDSVNPYESTKSLHITVPTGPSAHGTLSQQKSVGLVTGNDMYGRAMVYYSDSTGNGLPLNVHSWLFNSNGDSTVDDGGAVSMNMGGGGAKLQLNYHPPPDAGEQSVQGGMISAGSWHCIQWQYDGSGSPPNNVANVWIDGTLAVNAPASKGWQFATPWTTFDFGFTHYQSLDANAVEVFLDDFALNGTMIPCP